MEGKLEEFEKSLQKLKDCTYTEAAQRREYELSLLNAQAELRGSSLREQVLLASVVLLTLVPQEAHLLLGFTIHPWCRNF